MVMRCIHIGLLCVQDHAVYRPSMSDVVLMLSRCYCLDSRREITEAEARYLKSQNTMSSNYVMSSSNKLPNT
ncbi:hypothetical protein KY290_016533 [Solanum tuberosum]|uniref:S-locus receptor kinase C-terminal domain-containing protein n=1 Tax=Solanum tuberosum TaxID=4113 RepID=A0ABQ7V8N9_SOLTU|nr:hypothetical protein KY284_015816 [Solanum tuberosum]KAH0760460.1 hypothetical protein KY290_016533 [Solanum tuberosum]